MNNSETPYSSPHPPQLFGKEEERDTKGSRKS